MIFEPMPSADPQRIGRYRLLAEMPSAEPTFRAYLGAGPDDELYLIRRIQTGTAVDARFRIRLRHSAVAAARVDHPAVSKVFDFDTDNESPWLASAFEPGIRLDHVIAAHGPMPVPVVRQLASLLTRALAAVHGAGWIHRAVRPDAVWLTRDGLRLSDLGLTPSTDVSAITASERVSGPPDYLAPEQAIGTDPTAAADVFALGSVIAFAASGRALFTAPSVPYTLFNIAQRDPALDAVPMELRELIWGCVRKSPAERPTPGQILQYLGSVGGPSWPAPVLAGIEENRRQAAELLAAAPTGDQLGRIPRSKRLIGTAASAVAVMRRRWDGMSRQRRRWTGLAAVVGVVVAVSGVAVLAANDSAQRPGTGLSIAELRTVDSCAWLDQIIDGPISVQPSAIPEAEWQLTPIADWGCVAGARTSYSIFLHLGSQIAAPGTTFFSDTEVDGIPILRGGKFSCARSIASRDDPANGISVSVSEPSTDKIDGTTKVCGPASDELVGKLARTLGSAPRLPGDHSKSVAVLEACGLFDRESVEQAIGPLPAKPTVDDAHTCKWDGRVPITVEMQRRVDTAKQKRETLDGVEMVITGRCARGYLYPGADREMIEVTVEASSDSPAEYCGLAGTALRQLVDRLPVR
ncbi:protein kinase domain-containing protein [Nocardia sp. IBHARD005]|uniref:protein kinase domain-containing protein n=1 Tax=Nocardia sp. IBHARD005 TaxID=3457765 RepID=UPI0040595D22